MHIIPDLYLLTESEHVSYEKIFRGLGIWAPSSVGAAFTHSDVLFFFPHLSFMLFAAFHKMTLLKRWHYQPMRRNDFLWTSELAFCLGILLFFFFFFSEAIPIAAIWDSSVPCKVNQAAGFQRMSCPCAGASYLIGSDANPPGVQACTRALTAEQLMHREPLLAEPPLPTLAHGRAFCFYY